MGSSSFLKRELRLSYIVGFLAAFILFFAPVFAPTTFIVTLQEPKEGAYSNQTDINHTFLVQGFNGTFSCTLFYNTSSKGTNDSVQNDTLTTIVASSVEEGIYNWSVSCTNGSISASSGNRSITVDRTPPSLTVSSPISTTYNTSSIDLNYTVSDSISGLSSCWYTLDGGGIQALSGCSNTALSSLSDTSHTLVVYANDSAGNLNSYTVSGIVVNTSSPPVQPSLKLNYPSSNIYFNTPTVNLQVNITVEGMNYTNLSISSSNGTVVAETQITGSGEQIVPLSFSGEGIYSLNVVSMDASGNIFSANASNLVIDTTPPQVNITTPSTNSTLEDSRITVNFNPPDQNPDYAIVSVLKNGSAVNSTNTTGGPVTLSVYEIGIYTIKVQAYDKAGNNGTAEVSNVNVSKLYVEPPPSPGGSPKGGRRSSSGIISGGSAPSFWSITKDVTSSDFQEGYTTTLKERQRFKFRIGNETHYLGIVNLYAASAIINVSSEPQQFTVYISSETKAEVTGDSYYDVYFKLNSIGSGMANITVKFIHEKIFQKNESQVVQNTTPVETPPVVELPKCSEGEKRCISNEIEECKGGKWETSEICKTGCDPQTVECVLMNDPQRSLITYIPQIAFTLLACLLVIMILRLLTIRLKQAYVLSGRIGYNKILYERIQDVELKIVKLERKGRDMLRARKIMDEIKEDISSGLRNIAEGRLEILASDIELMEGD